jgi:hypothetical protein
LNSLNKYNLGIFILICTLLASCAGVKNTQIKNQLVESNCNQQNVYSYTLEDLPQPIYQLELDTALISRFSFKSLNIAHAIGIMSHLTEYVKTQKDYSQNPTLEKKIHLIELSQRINQRINVSSLEISAVASEMDCEEERTDQIASYLKGREDNAEKKFTVGAIIVGAAGAITTGILIVNGNESNTPDLIGIGTGLTEATLGLSILLNKRTVELRHERNALKEIWEGKETSTMFPPSVWYYLNYYNPNQPYQSSMRYQIIERWMSFGQIYVAKSKKKKSLINVYFGNGGKYSAEQLYNRASMLDQLEAQISLIKQDLKGLALELEILN